MRPLAILACSLFNAFSPIAQAQQPVFVEPVIEAEVQASERVLGSLRARSTSAVAALEEGVLLELTVREADTVQKGSLIARTDTRRLQAERTRMQAEILMAQASVLEHQANLENARADAQALAKAAESGAATDRDVRNANTLVLVGEAQLRGAQETIVSIQAAIALLEIRIADGQIFAPFDAIVSIRHAEVGQWIRPGDPLVTLVSTGPLEAWLNLPERYVGNLPSAPSIEVRLESSQQSVSGTDLRAIPVVDERVRTFPLILNLPAQTPSGRTLRAGMSISAVVPFGAPSKNLVVPKNAIVRRGNNSMVVKVDEGNLAAWVPVKVLFDAQGGFAVSPIKPGDLAPGTQVVVEGNERLFPGTPVLPSVKGAKPKEAPDEGPPVEEVPEERPPGNDGSDSSFVGQ